MSYENGNNQDVIGNECILSEQIIITMYLQCINLKYPNWTKNQHGAFMTSRSFLLQ